MLHMLLRINLLALVFGIQFSMEAPRQQCNQHSCKVKEECCCQTGRRKMDQYCYATCDGVGNLVLSKSGRQCQDRLQTTSSREGNLPLRESLPIVQGLPCGGDARATCASEDRPCCCGELNGQCLAHCGETPVNEVTDSLFAADCAATGGESWREKNVPQRTWGSGEYEFVSKCWETILVGTEFTFTNLKLMGIQIEEGEFGAAQLYFTDWIKLIPKNFDGERVTIEPYDKGKAKELAKKISYGNRFYWILDLDDGCIETQTMPLSMSVLTSNFVQKVIKTHIFGIAIERLSLEPHEEYGGGHLSLDVNTMFLNSGYVLAKFVGYLEQNWREWQDFFRDPDSLNAPWTAELKMSNKNENTLEKLMTVLINAEDQCLLQTELVLEPTCRLLMDFTVQLKNPLVEDLKKKKNLKRKMDDMDSEKHRPHYRAINLEHVLDDEVDKRRIELRRIKAQPSFEQFALDVRQIFTFFFQSLQH